MRVEPLELASEDVTRSDGHDREGFACRSRRRSLAGSMTRTRGNPLGARDAKPGRVPRGCYFKLAAVNRLGGSTPRASRYFPEERSTGGAQFPGLAHHFLDLGDVLLLELDLLTRVFLKPDALVNYEVEQIVVLAKRGALVIQGLLENLHDVVLVGLCQLADFQGRVAAKRRYVLAGHRGVVHALRGLVSHPAYDRNARVTEDHQRVMYIAHHPRELELEDSVEADDDLLAIDLVVFAGHGVLRA